MKAKEVKIQFYCLLQKYYKSSSYKGGHEVPFLMIKETLNYVFNLAKRSRFYTLKSRDKFCFLDNLQINGNILSGYFKSARSEFRPNLINKQTGAERVSPKQKYEGDIEKTHFVVKITTEEVYIFFEHNYQGITILNFVNYLKEFSKKYAAKMGLVTSYTLLYTMIARDNFLKELSNLKRTKIAEVHVDKKILGSKYLEFSNRAVGVQHDVMLTIKAERMESIKDVAVDLFNSFSGNRKNSISKIRIYGTDANGNPAIIDTSFMGQADYISVNLDNDTGEVISTDLINGINNIIKSL